MTNREVAIKALAKTAYPASRIKFLLTEFQAMSKIWGHPNIVSIHTVEPGEDDYVAWIVMEYVEGKSLHELMQEGALSLTDTLNIGLDICRGLKTAHGHKIMHSRYQTRKIFYLQLKKRQKSPTLASLVYLARLPNSPKPWLAPRRYMAHRTTLRIL